MKKLLITSMAAVAIGLYAKADDTGFTETSENFESKDIGPLFEQGEVGTADEGKYIVDRSEWSTAATPDDGVFTVTNITDITTKAGYTLADGNTKALAIDTSASLMRNAVTSGDASQTGYVMAGDESIFFDSLVQFTATESIPTPSTGDKLVIGLFADEDPEVNADLGALDNATNLVVISAVLNQNGEIVANATNIIDNTDLNVGPEEWHRLTIQVMNNSGFDANVKVPGFKVFVDEKEVKVNEENKIFHSLVKFVNSGNVLKGVAFEGKGAVDDLVFTTTDPFDEDDPVIQNFTIKLSETDDFWDVSDRKYSIDNGEFVAVPNDMSVLIPTGSKKVKFAITMGGAGDGEEYTITAKLGETALTVEKDNVNKVCNFEIDVENTAANVELLVSYTVVKVGGSGDEPGTDPDPETPTVDPTSGTLSAEVAGAEDADPGAIADQVTISISAADTDAGVKAEYFKKTAEYDPANSWWVVTVALDETVVQPSADEALEEVAAELTGDETTVSITYKGDAIKPGLYYGLAAAGDLTALKTAVPASFARATEDDGVVLSADKPEGNAGFFKVVISATNPNPVQE